MSEYEHNLPHLNEPDNYEDCPKSFIHRHIDKRNFEFWQDKQGRYYAKKKINSIMKITKKFYVGSQSIVNGQRADWAKKTLTEAIKHAQELAEETEQDQIVVQVVRVVRVQKRPTIVEKV